MLVETSFNDARPGDTRTGAVVLNWRDYGRTTRCVSELVKSSLLSDIVVVDSESAGTLATLLPPDPRIRLIEHSYNVGFAAGVNSGIRVLMKNSDVRSILVINNDAILPVDSLRALITALDEDQSLAMVGPRNFSPSGKVLSNGGVFNWWTWGADEMGENLEPDFLTWACVLIPVSTFRNIGLLDERYFMYYEDADFAIRLRRASMRFAVVRTARVIHEIGSSHCHAGKRIEAYAAASFRHFIQVYGGNRRWTGLTRLYLKVMIAILKCDFSTAQYIIAGWRLGRCAPDPIYLAFAEMPAKSP